MPLDGVVSDCIAQELNKKLVGGRIVKVFQPGKEEICLHIWSRGTGHKLLISVNPTCPRIHLTGASRENPYNPPVFCMLLRKHLSGGKILGIGINDFERIFTINAESVNELGEISEKKIIVEIMGRHSNIILVNEYGKIIDSIRHVDSEMSRVREVMPAREYVMPPSQDKTSPVSPDIEHIMESAALPGNAALQGNAVLQGNVMLPGNAALSGGNMSIEKYLLNNIKGFSPFLCKNICIIAGIDEKTRVIDVINDKSLVAGLKNVLCRVIGAIKNRNYKPFIIYRRETAAGSGTHGAQGEQESALDFHCLPLWQEFNSVYSDNAHNIHDLYNLHNARIEYFDSMSLVLDKFYSEKDFNERFEQKKSNLAKVINVNIERCEKKLAIQQDVLREAAGMDRLKLYGELVTAYIHSIPPNAKKVSLPDYNSPDGEIVDIELDGNKSPQKNAQIYFKRYNKAKSTYYNTAKQIEDTREELAYLESVLHLLDNCSSLEDIGEIREELIEQGYISFKSKKAGPGRKKAKEAPGVSSKPYRFKSSDGFDIYAGKNNKQNDFLTCRFAAQNDIWLHVKNIPGSHTIIKCKKNEVPAATLEEAANIAAWYSKASGSSNVPVDYTMVKHVKKISGAKPGMVIYENYRTLFVTPDENLVKRLKIE